jgi:hypothetical protein
LTAAVPRELGEITCANGYRGLVSVMQARAAERQIALGGEAVAEVSGLPRGYFQKILSPLPKSREDVRRIGIASLGPVLGVLGIKLVVVEDLEALERYGSRIPKCDQGAMRNGVVHLALSRRFLSKIGAAGGANSRKFIGKRRSRAIAKKAAAARWRPQATIEAPPSVPAPKP